jgi:hypothetical protein
MSQSTGISAVPHSQGVTGRLERHLLRCLVLLFIFQSDAERNIAR